MVNPLRDALKASPQICSTSATLILRDRYETTYGIYDHDKDDGGERPLALVAMHWQEDASTDSLLYERIAQFEEKQVFKRFGLSLLQFFELPTDICMRILEISAAKQTKEGTMASQVLSELNDPTK